MNVTKYRCPVRAVVSIGPQTSEQALQADELRSFDPVTSIPATMSFSSSFSTLLIFACPRRRCQVVNEALDVDERENGFRMLCLLRGCTGLYACRL